MLLKYIFAANSFFFFLFLANGSMKVASWDSPADPLLINDLSTFHCNKVRPQNWNQNGKDASSDQLTYKPSPCYWYTPTILTYTRAKNSLVEPGEKPSGRTAGASCGFRAMNGTRELANDFEPAEFLSMGLGNENIYSSFWQIHCGFHFWECPCEWRLCSSRWWKKHGLFEYFDSCV